MDQDTGPDNLTFTVTSSKKGYVAFATAPSISVRHFKQSQIDSHQVLFVHTGIGADSFFDVSLYKEDNIKFSV